MTKINPPKFRKGQVWETPENELMMVISVSEFNGKQNVYYVTSDVECDSFYNTDAAIVDNITLVSDLIPQPVFDPKPSEDYQLLLQQFNWAKTLINSQAAQILHYSKQDLTLSQARLHELLSIALNQLELHGTKDTMTLTTHNYIMGELMKLYDGIIPQPITDKAKAKALDEVEYLMYLAVVDDTGMVDSDVKVRVRNALTIIKAAL